MVPIRIICACCRSAQWPNCLACRKTSCTPLLLRDIGVTAKAHHVYCTQLPFPKYAYRVLARAHVFFLVPAGVAHGVPHADKIIQDRIVAIVLAHPDAIVPFLLSHNIMRWICLKDPFCALDNWLVFSCDCKLGVFSESSSNCRPKISDRH